MIIIFNRKELLITLDMNRKSNVRDILAENGIEYAIKVTNLQRAFRNRSNRGRSGSFGINQKYIYEYKVYVRKDDYEKAVLLIQ